MSPAQRVIKKCGGVAAVAEMVGIHVTNVHRWTYPKERGGSAGLVPSQHQQTLLVAARERGIDLSPADFFDMPDEGAAEPAAQGAAA